MSVTYVIPTRFTAVDGISPVVRTMSGNISGMAGKLNTEVARQERLFRKLTPGLSGATKQLLAYGSAGLALGAAGATGKAIMDNETAMQSLSAVTGVAGDDFTRMRREVDQLARDTRKSSTDIAGSFEVVGSMMSQYLSDPKALREITRQGIILAKASRQELVPTLENLTSIMNQFDLKANQATETINRLTAGEIVGSLRTSQVAEQMQEFGAGAFAANVSLTESVALVEALAKQMKTDKIGVGARNILTVMDSATGLARKARKELRAAGVDMGFLMDKTKSLSERLHELYKVSGNEKAITKIFGRENKTAAQVIFNQLGVFDQYVEKIAKTNQAEQQARTNSETFANSIDQLKNEWVNYFVVEDRAKTGLTALTKGTRFLTENMSGLIDMAVNAVKVYALWKGAIVVTKLAANGMNVALGIQTALTTANATALEGNTVALVANNLALKAQAAWIALTTGNMVALQTVLLANPFTAAVIGAAALTFAISSLIDQKERLSEQYNDDLNSRIEKAQDSETKRVDDLIDKYVGLGKSRKEAAYAAIEAERVSIALESSRNQAEIDTLKKQLESKRVNLGVYGTVELPGAGAIHDQLLPKMQNQTELAERNRRLTDITIDKTRKDATGRPSQTFGEKDKFTNSETTNLITKKPDVTQFDPFDYNKMAKSFADALRSVSLKPIIQLQNTSNGLAYSGGMNIPNSN